MGHRAPLRRLRRPRRHRRPRLGRAAPLCLERLPDGRRYRTRPADRHAPPRAQHGRSHHGCAVRRQPVCTGAADRGRAGRVGLAFPQGRAGCDRRRLSGMARPVLCKSIRRGARRGGRRDGEPGAARFARQHAKIQSRQGAARACSSSCETDAMVRKRPAHRAFGRCAQSRPPGGGGFHQGRR